MSNELLTDTLNVFMRSGLFGIPQPEQSHNLEESCRSLYVFSPIVAQPMWVQQSRPSHCRAFASHFTALRQMVHSGGRDRDLGHFGGWWKSCCRWLCIGHAAMGCSCRTGVPWISMTHLCHITSGGLLESSLTVCRGAMTWFSRWHCYRIFFILGRKFPIGYFMMDL